MVVCKTTSWARGERTNIDDNVDPKDQLLNVVDLLLDKAFAHGGGANAVDAMIAKRGHCGSTPLHFATEKGSTAVVEKLLLRSAPKHSCVSAVNQNGETALKKACNRGFYEIARLILEHHGKSRHCRGFIDLADCTGTTPLLTAAGAGRNELVELLLRHGAHPSLRGRPGGPTPLHTAVAHGNGTVVQLLLQHGANVNATVPTLRRVTPLHVACARRDHVLARVLADQGADVLRAHESRHGLSPLEMACRNGDEDTVRVLIASGVGSLLK